MSLHRDRMLALSIRSDELITKSMELTRDSDRIRAHAHALRKKMRDMQPKWDLPAKKMA